MPMIVADRRGAILSLILYHFVRFVSGDAGKEVIIAGLDADAFQRKWGQVLDCIPLASEVTKLSALCMHCGNGKPGPFTKRTVEDTKLELIGGSDMYIAVCQKHL
jgi:thymidine kinase